MHQFLTLRGLSAASLGVALVTVWWVPRCPAPQPDKPEKISIDTVVWNSQASGFHVELSARFGIATAGDNAGFTIRTVLLIYDSDLQPIDFVTQEDLLVKQAGAGRNDDGFVRIAPQVIAWDSDFIGPAIVVAVCDVLNPAGGAMASASTTTAVFVERDER